MDGAPYSIPFTSLIIGFGPTLIVLWMMYRWRLSAGSALYANARMLLQLLLIGYVLTYVFETDQPLIIIGVVILMIGVSSWIALRPLKEKGLKRYLTALIAIGACGLAMLGLVTQLVLELPQWFEPRFVVPLAGMIFANAMNTVSLAGRALRSGARTGARGSAGA